MNQAPAGTEVTAAWAVLPKVEILPGQEIQLTLNPTPTQDTTRVLP